MISVYEIIGVVAFVIGGGLGGMRWGLPGIAAVVVLSVGLLVLQNLINDGSSGR